MSSSCICCWRLFMGMPGAVAVADSMSAIVLEGVGEIPAGVPIEVGTMKSSRFMASSVCVGLIVWSEDCRSCAMPLGALRFCCGRAGNLIILLLVDVYCQ